MSVWALSPIEVSATLGMAAMAAAVALCFVRLALGPTLSDRVLALDLIAILLVGALVLQGIAGKDRESLQVATVLALLNFLGTTGFATYIRRKAAR
ncbi:MAG: hypothetical protein KY476_08095 [Planctomycetes bacterium]|nr:hypothetical protein [Planctomycetota bacterium]